MHTRSTLLACLLTCFVVSRAQAQDLYDDTVLRTVHLDFPDPDWWNQLLANYDAKINIPADMTVDGITYPAVGVRIKGNTSFNKLPTGSQKVSFAIEMDWTDDTQDLYGYNTLNFNNAFTDPTFCREVAFFNYISRYIPNGRGNHVKVVCNGENWGVYANLQQYNKDMLEDYFADEDGVRIKCPNKPSGPGLRWEGSTSTNYEAGYEIHDDGGLPDPWKVLIDTCDVLNHEPVNNWPAIDEVFAIDPSMWTLASENLFTDDDSYVNKGADFNVYWDPQHSRMHLHQHDGNESFRDWNMPPLYQINNPDKPVMHRLWSVSELKERYLAHLRTMLEEFDWNELETVLYGYRDLIDAEVQADTKKIYSYQMFLDNFDTTVNLGGGGPGGGSVIGLKEFVEQRRSYLLGHPALNHPVPVFQGVEVSSSTPLPGEAVTVLATMDPLTPVSEATLYWRAAAGRYQSTAMFDDGQHGDGGANDAIWGVQLPVAGAPGESVEYYVGARSTVGPRAMTFSPSRSEMAPLTLGYQWGTSGLKITEYMYSGLDGEFVELTNTTAANLDLTGWSLDDQSNEAGTFDLSGAGVLAPGESVIVTEALPVLFSSAWGLSGTMVLGPNLDAPFGRNDEINVYDAAGDLVERLTYGDEDFAGSVRAKEFSANPCGAALGADDPMSWSLSAAGDTRGSQASTGGDVGNPGSFTLEACSGPGTDYCSSNPNSTGSPAALTAEGSVVVADNDITFHVGSLPNNKFGYLLMSETQGFVPLFGGSQGNLCLGGSLIRFSKDVLNSGSTGTVSFSPDLTDLPQGSVISSGSQWNFQYWYRDVNPSQTSNTSNGLAVDFI